MSWSSRTASPAPVSASSSATPPVTHDDERRGKRTASVDADRRATTRQPHGQRERASRASRASRPPTMRQRR